MSQLKKKTTLQDVADAAGVSIATVSRAINNKESVKEGTYDKIIQAIYALGYDAAVRHESHLILILLPDIDNPFYSEVIRGISAAAGRQSYQEIIVRTGAHPLTLSFIEEMIEKTHADGVITLDPIPSADTISQLELHTPLIQCAEYNENSPTSYVSIDDVAASRAVVEYILSKGKRRVALINGPCAGIGLIQALVCDVRFMVRGARLSTAYAKLGIPAEYGMSWIIPRLVGIELALDLLLSARRVDGEEAQRIGLVSRVCDDATVLAEALAYARLLATGSSPRSMAAIRRQVWGDLSRTYTEANEVWLETMVRMNAPDNPDFSEGVSAMAQKRAPAFAPLPADYPLPALPAFVEQ